MKQLSVFLALLLAMSPVALANDDEAKEACQDAPDREACMERWCKAHDCEDSNETRTQRPSDTRPANHSDRPEPTARPTDHPHAPLRDGFDGRWVDFKITDGKIVHYTVDGTLVATAIDVDGQLKDIRRDGDRIRIQLDNGRLTIADNPTGLMAYQGDGIHVAFAEGTNITVRGDRHQVRGASFAGPLDGDNLTIAGTEVRAEKLKFHIAPGLDRARAAHVDAAIQDRRVAGEVQLDGADVLVYDDVNITVESQDAGYRVVFDADLESGRTFVLDGDPSLLAGRDLELRYFDVRDDGTETEGVFRMADSLMDILDATDDGGQPEYWVVEDADGMQVMVSVPHWSVHAVTIQGVGAFLTQPSVLIGAGAGIVGVAVAALLMLRPRKLT